MRQTRTQGADREQRIAEHAGADGIRARLRRPEPARDVSFAGFGVASLANFSTGIAWLHPGIFVGMAVLSALIAVPAGHVGRFRGRRLDGEGRGTALLGIVVGWLLLFVCALAVLAYIGLIAGLAFLADAF
ncbi:hypothetical protein [Streptomyces sp. NPDC056240]|uniref:hypothetical protein n=1 Tax=Streptomyces sp. NPDC056240 TaxID=3345759 RepID=UPI0035E284F4